MICVNGSLHSQSVADAVVADLAALNNYTLRAGRHCPAASELLCVVGDGSVWSGGLALAIAPVPLLGEGQGRGGHKDSEDR